MKKKISGLPRPQFEDYLRAAGYLTVMVWSVLFVFFPTPVFAVSVDFQLRTLWMGATFLGAFTALVGSLTGIDLKLEFPGLLVAFLGPVFYFVSQVYFYAFPAVGDTADRTALVIYALLPAILMLPRAFSLHSEGRRLKKLNAAVVSLREGH